MKNCIHIFLWGQEIGSLMWRDESRNSYFVYNPAYLKSPIEPFPLVAPKPSMPFRAFESESDRKYQRLPAFLADSLPDNWGNTLFEEWYANQHCSMADLTPLHKLAFIGMRGMGALEFQPDAELSPYTETVNIGELAQLAHKIFTDREEAHIAPDEELTKQLLIEVGSSAGGRQPKAIIAIHRETGEIRSGQIAGQEGYDYYILKFGDPERTSAELEMAYYEMACAAGIDMMHSELMSADGENHFMTQRFDRPNGEKIHIQTLAAINPSVTTYEGLMFTCRRLRMPDGTGEEIFRRMVFNYLANNTDDHDKNVSFIMTRDGKWSLAPAYDITFIFNRGGFQPENDHCMLMRGKASGWTKEDVLQFAEDNDIRGAEKIIHQVAEAICSFPLYATRNAVSQEWIARVNACLSAHLAEWGLRDKISSQVMDARIDGIQVENIHLEQAYKGNIHLCATIDGKQRKYIFRPTAAEYSEILSYNLSDVPRSLLMEWVKKYLLK